MNYMNWKELNIPEKDLSITEMDSERSLNIKGRSQVNIPSYDLALKAANLFEQKLRIASSHLFDVMYVYLP